MGTYNCTYFQFNKQEKSRKLNTDLASDRVCDIIHGTPEPNFQTCLDNGKVRWYAEDAHSIATGSTKPPSPATTLATTIGSGIALPCLDYNCKEACLISGECLPYGGCLDCVPNVGECIKDGGDDCSGATINTATAAGLISTAFTPTTPAPASDTCSSHNCTGAACLVTTRGATPTVHCVGYRNAGCMGEKCLPDAEDCIKEGWEDCSANECFELETEHPPLTGWSRCEGEDGTALKTNTAKQCQEECAKKDGCQGFSWNSPALNHYNPENKLICCLKEVFNANDASHFGGIVSGPKKCGE